MILRNVTVMFKSHEGQMLPQVGSLNGAAAAVPNNNPNPNPDKNPNPNPNNGD